MGGMNEVCAVAKRKRGCVPLGRWWMGEQWRGAGSRCRGEVVGVARLLPQLPGRPPGHTAGPGMALPRPRCPALRSRGCSTRPRPSVIFTVGQGGSHNTPHETLHNWGVLYTLALTKQKKKRKKKKKTIVECVGGRQIIYKKGTGWPNFQEYIALKPVVAPARFWYVGLSFDILEVSNLRSERTKPQQLEQQVSVCWTAENIL